MAIEIEKKYRVNADQFAVVISALSEDGAIFHGDEDEVNIIYGGPPLVTEAARALKARG